MERYSLLSSYWKEKERIGTKYTELLRRLKEEELAEIKLCAGKRGNVVSENIKKISEYYENVASLILRQMLVEEEEVLGKYKTHIVSPSVV